MGKYSVVTLDAIVQYVILNNLEHADQYKNDHHTLLAPFVT